MPIKTAIVRKAMSLLAQIQTFFICPTLTLSRIAATSMIAGKRHKASRFRMKVP